MLKQKNVEEFKGKAATVFRVPTHLSLKYVSELGMVDICKSDTLCKQQQKKKSHFCDAIDQCALQTNISIKDRRRGSDIFAFDMLLEKKNLYTLPLKRFVFYLS